MPETPSYSDLQTAFLWLDYLRMDLDFAMWLNIAYVGKPDTTPVSLIKEPQRTLDGAVKAYVAEHRADLLPAYKVCPVCKTQYARHIPDETCPATLIPHWRRPLEGYSHKKIMEMPRVPCGAPLKLVIHETQDVAEEEDLHEKGANALGAAGAVEALCHTVSAWLTQELHRPARMPAEVSLPLNKVFELLLGKIERDLDRVLFHVARIGDVLNLDGRRNLPSKGKTLADRHADYSSVRDKLMFCHQRLWGLGRGHPEFRELEEEPRYPRRFPPAVALPATRRPVGGSELPWDDKAEGFIYLTDAIKMLPDGVAPTRSAASKLLKPEGPIRHMRKGRRCKEHVNNWQTYFGPKPRQHTDAELSEAMDQFYDSVEGRKKQAHKRKVSGPNA